VNSPSVAARPVPELRFVGGGVDTLYLFWVVPIARAEVARLELLKADAQLVGRAGQLPTVTLGGEVFEVQPNGGVSGRYLLKNEAHMTVHVEPDPHLASMPTIYVELRSFLLWQAGADAAVAAAQRVVYDLVGDNATDEQLRAHVSWLHLCVDFQGMHPTVVQFTPRRCKEQMGGFCNEQLYTRCREVNPHLGTRYTGMTYGTKTSGISAGFYNKTIEIEKSSNKTWFEDVWKKSGKYQPTCLVNGKEVKQDVWRLEFRLRREGLTEFMKSGAIENFDTWEDVRDHLEGLWRYLTSMWLVMRGARSKKDRLANPVTPFWQQFVDAGEKLLQTAFADVLRTKLSTVAKRAAAQGAGALLQIHACLLWSQKDERPTFEQQEAEVIDIVRKYMTSAKWDVDDRVKRYLKRWAAMEHLQLMGEDLAEEASA
jgi:hypothetical protein